MFIFRINLYFNKSIALDSLNVNKPHRERPENDTTGVHTSNHRKPVVEGKWLMSIPEIHSTTLHLPNLFCSTVTSTI